MVPTSKVRLALISRHLPAAAAGFPLRSLGQIDESLAYLVGRLHLLAADPVDSGLTGTHGGPDGLFRETRCAESVDGG